MPTPGDRRKARKSRRVPSGKTVLSFFREKSSKKTCGLCTGVLHGVAHGKRKAEVLRLSKTQKRPQRLFGGVLCSSCETNIIEETAKVKAGVKDISSVPFVEKKFVEMAFKKVGE